MSSHHDTTVLEQPLQTFTAAQVTSSPDEDYQPLPEGCWTFPFHGNCPKCRHHHRAFEVQVKVSRDAGHVSYVYCEKCGHKWVAFGGRNSTRISLLSTTTSESDSTDKQVHYSLVQIVKLAAAKKALGTLPESPSPTIFRRNSKAASSSGSLRAFASSDIPAIRSPSPRVDEASHERSKSVEQTPANTKGHTRLLRKRDRTVQLFSELKFKLTTQISRLRRAQLKLKLKLPHKQPASSTGQLKHSHTRAPQTTTLIDVPADDPPATVHEQSVLGDEAVGATESVRDEVEKPTGRLTDMVIFIAELDKELLASLDEQERIKWMRKTYTEYKNRKKTTLQCSSITETSTTPLGPPLSGFSNRRSAEVFGAGFHHIEGLDGIVRRHSIATSDGASERWWDMDENTVVSVAATSGATPLQRPRPETGLPPAIPDRSPMNQTHRRSRQSLELHLHNRIRSLSSLRGNAGSRLSQGSITVHGSMTNIPQMLAQYDERRSSNPRPPLPRPTSS